MHDLLICRKSITRRSLLRCSMMKAGATKSVQVAASYAPAAMALSSATGASGPELEWGALGTGEACEPTPDEHRVELYTRFADRRQRPSTRRAWKRGVGGERRRLAGRRVLYQEYAPIQGSSAHFGKSCCCASQAWSPPRAADAAELDRAEAPSREVPRGRGSLRSRELPRPEEPPVVLERPPLLALLRLLLRWP